MDRRVRSRWAAVLIGALAAVGAASIVGGPADPAPVPAEPAQVLAEFTDRWEAWRLAAARYTETIERVSGDRRLEQTAEMVQRFPDRVVRDGDTVNGRVGGRRIGCVTTGVDATPSCVDNGPVDAGAELAAEIDEFERLTGGAAAIYRISDLGDGCFRLRHVADEFRLRWGDRTDICFDARSGVATRETTVVGDVTTTTRRSVSGAEVTDEDFDLPAVPVPSPARTEATTTPSS